MPNSIERYSRQADLVPHETIVKLTATIIGVGAVGRQLAIQLAAVGVRQFLLIDPDHVDASNIASQGFPTIDLDRPKVHAVADSISAYDPMIAVETLQDRWRPRCDTSDVVFSCVDSIRDRAAIWKSMERFCRFWADARMLSETVRILTAIDPPSRAYYPTTLFEPRHAEPGRCTARSTIYAAAVAAGLLVHQFARWLRGQPTDADIILSLVSTELVVLR